MGTDCGNSVDLFDLLLLSVSEMSTNHTPLRTPVTCPTPVTLIGASDVEPQDLAEALAIAPYLVAADGGAATALQHGHTPRIVIGDFDSLPHSVTKVLTPDQRLRVEEQDSTDFEKCLERLETPLILAVGFAGRRLDHELAVYNALVRFPATRCLVLGTHDLVFHAPRELALTLDVGERLSLFPMAPVTGWSEGLRWPIGGIAFAPDGRVGTSNAVTGPVALRFDGDGMLVILPRKALPQAVKALMPG